jgi:tetratricopeptide (TPR) repeat protein
VEAAGAFRRAVKIDPDHADTWARLAALLLKMGNVTEGKASARRAFDLDPDLPMAALAQARLEAWKGDWQGMVDILSPVLEAYPTFSEAHRQIGRAYAMLGEDELSEHHFSVGEYGAEMTSPDLEELFSIAVPAILGGDAQRGQLLIEDRCVRCHTLERTFYREGRDIRWWAATVRRMQRLAGRDLLHDDEAADVAAFLASQREPDDTVTTP